MARGLGWAHPLLSLGAKCLHSLIGWRTGDSAEVRGHSGGTSAAAS